MKREEKDKEEKEDEKDKKDRGENIKPNAKLKKALDNLAATSLRYSDSMNNAIYKDMVQPLSGIIAHENAVSSIVKNSFPTESIASLNQQLAASDYFIKVTEDLFPKDSVATFVGKLCIEDKFKDIIDYPVKHLADTYKEATQYLASDSYNIMVKSCLDEITKSKIDFSKLCTISNIFSESFDKFEEVDELSENDVTEVVDNVKKIIKDVEENDDLNWEQKIHSKYCDIEKIHPITIRIIVFIVGAILSAWIGNIFFQNATNYYINNYCITKPHIVNDSDKDISEHASYVDAKRLTVRKAPGKENDVVTVLEFGMVVKIIDKTNYWTKIQYINKEENIEVEGWVYSRYLEKFK